MGFTCTRTFSDMHQYKEEEPEAVKTGPACYFPSHDVFCETFLTFSLIFTAVGSTVCPHTEKLLRSFRSCYSQSNRRMKSTCCKTLLTTVLQQNIHNRKLYSLKIPQQCHAVTRRPQPLVSSTGPPSPSESKPAAAPWLAEHCLG